MNSALINRIDSFFTDSFYILQFFNIFIFSYFFFFTITRRLKMNIKDFLMFFFKPLTSLIQTLNFHCANFLCDSFSEVFFSRKNLKIIQGVSIMPKGKEFCPTHEPLSFQRQEPLVCVFSSIKYSWLPRLVISVSYY